MKDTSVYQRTGRKNWHVAYFCPKKMKRVCEPTAWRIDDPTGHKHAWRYASLKAEEARAFRGIAKGEFFHIWVDAYLRDRYRGESRMKTLTRYINAWDWLRVYLDEKKLSHPQGVTYKHVIDYVAWRMAKKRHCGKTTHRNTAITEIKVLGVIMGEACRREYAVKNPCLKLAIQRDPPKQKPEILDSEIKLIRTMLAEKEGALPITERWMTISFEIAIHHGCRFSETSVPMTSIDVMRNTIRFSAKGKNGVPKIYTVEIHHKIRPMIMALIDAGAQRTCTIPSMGSKEWHSFLHSREELKHLCFHCTRVTVITRLARAGVPIQQTMAYVGHSSESIHEIYLRLKAQDLSRCTVAIHYDEPSMPQNQDGKKSNPESCALSCGDRRTESPVNHELPSLSH